MDVEYWLNGICFRWNRRKAASNLRRHAVAFEDACEAFFDPFVHWLDSELVEGEERERLIGMTADSRLLVVVHVGRNDVVRLVSARAVTMEERREYEDY